MEIANVLNKEPGNYLKEITNDIEKKIVYGTLENDKEVLKKYIINNYGG